MSEKRYDLIVFGATSFVGQILCNYLLDQFGSSNSLKWALAGRSRSKLQDLRVSLGQAGADLPLILADATDEGAVREMCAQTRVVASTAGPYALFGEPLVKVCSEMGTDYCDLTGEVHWIKRMIERYEKAARTSGARIVHCCGFDSVPMDMGVYFLQEQARKHFGSSCSHVKMRVKAMRGGISGGTAASMMNVAKEVAANPALRKELANPYSLCPPEDKPSTRQDSLSKPKYDADFDAWLAPFVMAAINTRVVHRSNALRDYVYGRDFRYDEAVLTGRGGSGRLKAYMVTAGLAGFLGASAVAPSRWLLKRFVMPAPGEGPKPEDRKRGFYDLRFLGKTKDGQTIRTKVTGQGDPGYGSTSKILGQAAACLAFDVSKTDKPGGFWTPSTIFGERLLDRLQAHAQLMFEVMD